MSSSAEPTPEPEYTPVNECTGEPEPVAEALVTPAHSILIPTLLLCLLIITGKLKNLTTLSRHINIS